MNTETIERPLLYSIWAGILLLLLMPFIVTPQTIFPFVVGKAIYSRVIIEVIFGLWVALAYINPDYRIPRSRFFLLFGAYVAVSFIAGLFGVSPLRSLWSTYERMQGLVDLVHWFAFIVVLASTLRTALNWRLLLNANLGASLVMALLGIAQFLGMSNIPLYEFLETKSRLDITLGNPTYVGAYMLVNVIIALGFLWQSFMASPEQAASSMPASRRRRRRARARESGGTNLQPVLMRSFWVVVLLLDLWVLTLTGTRGAFIGLVAGLAAFALGYALMGNLRILRFAALGLTGFAAVALVLFFSLRNTAAFEGITSSNTLAQRMSTISLDDRSLRVRMVSWSAGLDAFTNRPVLGWGPENYVVAYGRYLDTQEANVPTHDQAHNKPIEELTTKGVIGFLSYIALWGVAAWIVLGTVRRLNTREQVLTLSVGAALVGYFVQNLFLFDTPATTLQLSILFAFVAYLDARPWEDSVSVAGRERQSGRSRATEDFPPAWLTRFAFVEKAIKPRTSAQGEQPVPRTGQRGSRLLRTKVRGLAESSLRATMLPVAGGAVLLALIGAGIFFHVKAYNAASAIVQVSRPGNSFGQTIGYFEQSIASFQPLANYPRLILFINLADKWDTLTEAQADQALALVEEEARRAIEAEPENWRIYKELARLYQEIAKQDPAYTEQAREYLDKASELAPRQEEVLDLLAKQEAEETP
jgi:O-antigen ligase